MRKLIIFGAGVALGIATGAAIEKLTVQRQLEKEKTKTNKFREYYNLLNGWLKLKLQKKSLSCWFQEENINYVAIYGMGEIGYRLIEELHNSGVTVKYGIDRKPEYAYGDFEIKSLDEEIEGVDAIIITPIFAFEEVENELKRKFSGRIISIDDIIFDIA